MRPEIGRRPHARAPIAESGDSSANTVSVGHDSEALQSGAPTLPADDANDETATDVVDAAAPAPSTIATAAIDGSTGPSEPTAERGNPSTRRDSDEARPDHTDADGDAEDRDQSDPRRQPDVGADVAPATPPTDIGFDPQVQADQVAPMLREARAAHARGWVLTPLAGKVPTKKGWQKAPKPGLEEVERWATRHNLGALTGKPSGFVVIDDDTEGCTAATTLGLPRTVTAVTGSGGRHHYFKMPPFDLRNSAGELGSNIDVRANGGMIVLPGSVHPVTGELYRWLEGHDPDSIELAVLPDALLERMRPRRDRRPVTVQRRVQDSAVLTLAKLCADVANAPEGMRNDTLNRAAFTAGGYVAAGVLDHDRVLQELGAAAVACGLELREVESTLGRGVAAGMEAPLEREHLLRSAGITISASASTRPTPPRDMAGRPEILLMGGELPEILAACQSALAGLPQPPIFKRGGALVHLVRSDPATMREVEGGAVGRLHTVDVKPDWLRALLTKHAVFYRPDRRSGECVPTDCPLPIARGLLEQVDGWTFPAILSIVNAPTLRVDGSVLQAPGYDPKTTIYLDTGNATFPQIPESPARSDALEALAALKFVLKDFPFQMRADLSVVLAAILTSLIRPSLRAAPLFAISAPKMASGKSMLTDIVALIATGHVGQAMSQGADEEEDRKRLLAVLKEGDPVVVIDNVDRPLAGSALCSILTQETYRGRILGSTQTASLPTCVTFIANGNNLVVKGDLTTRVLICNLDPGIERPEEREFDIDPRSYVSAHRGALAAAALTILRAYHCAGRPDQRLVPFGRFEEFSDFVRSALVWLGEADPCETRANIEDGDPERQLHVEFMTAWLDAFGAERLTCRELTDRAVRMPPGARDHQLMREVLTEIAGTRNGPISTRRLGKWLASKKGRIEGGMRIVEAGLQQGACVWTVDIPAPPPPPHRVGGAGDVTHRTHQTHGPSSSLPPPGSGVAHFGEFEECGEFHSPPLESVAGGGREASEERNLPTPEDEDERVTGAGLRLVGGDRRADRAAPARPDGPRFPCSNCRAWDFWRLADAGHDRPGDWRCATCCPPGVAAHRLERFESSGGAA